MLFLSQLIDNLNDRLFIVLESYFTLENEKIDNLDRQLVIIGNR